VAGWKILGCVWYAFFLLLVCSRECCIFGTVV
jgi:hypothetical protein